MVSPVISLRDITKSYGQGAAKTQVLRGVSLDIAPGELVALVGQSGSGKSTLLNIMGGLDKADGGEVTVLDPDCPTSATSSPGAMSRDTPRKTWVLAAPWP